MFISLNENEISNQLRESLTFTNYFLNTFVSAYYVNMADGSCQIYKRTDELERDYPIVSHYLDSLTEYINRDVHPDDRKALLEVTRPERMRALLAESPEYRHVFRDISGDREKIYRLQIIRGADENHVAFGFVDITEEVAEQNRRQREAEEYMSLIASVASIYRFAFAVDMADGSVKLIRMDREVRDVVERDVFSCYCDVTSPLLKMLHPADRVRMENELEFDTIRRRLKDSTTYNVEYRVIFRGTTEWHEMNVTRISDGEIAMGFGEKDIDITKRHLEENRFSEYFALYEVDIDREVVKIVIDSPYYGIDKPGTSRPYSSTMKTFAETLDGEAKVFFRQLSDIEYVKKELAGEGKHTYTYRSDNLAGKRWVDCTSFVTYRHDDGSASMFTLGFSFIDSQGAARQELLSRIAEQKLQLEQQQKQLQDALDAANVEAQKNDLIINAIHAGKWSYDISANDEITGARYSDDIYALTKSSASGNPMGWLDHLVPEDRDRILNSFMAAIFDHSGNTPYDVSFRVITGKRQYCWFRSAGRVIRHPDGTGEFTGMTMDLTEQMAQQEKLASRTAISDYFLKAYFSACYVDLTRNEVLVLHADKGDAAPLVGKTLPMEEINAIFLKYIHPDDRAIFTENLNPDFIRSRIADGKEFSFTFRDISDLIPGVYRGTIIPGNDENHAAVGFKDITEELIRQKDEEIVRDQAKQQRNMKAFGDMVNAALWTIRVSDEDEIINVYWSNEVRRMLGFEETQEDFPNTIEAWTDIIHPEDRPGVLEHFNSSLMSHDTDKFVYDSVFRMRRKSGEYIWYHAVGRMEDNDDGSRNLFGIVFDISTEKQLEEQQKELKAALESAEFEAGRNNVLISIVQGTTFTYEISADDKITAAHYVQASIDRMGEEYASRPMGWVEILHPEDRERVEAAFAATVSDHSGSTPYDVTFRMLDIDGNYRYVRSGGNAIRRADGSGEFYGMSLDITRQMEEQKKRLLGAIPISSDILNKANIGMWAFELDEGQQPRMYVDETMLGLIGLSEQVPPEATYHAWYDHIDEGSYDLVADAVEKMSAGEHAEVQYPWHHPDGHTLVVRCGGVRNPEYTKGIRIEGTHQDVTQTLHFDEEERKREEQQRKDEIARIEAESSNKAKTEFLFNMSHDIRTPMNAILGYTNIALNHLDETDKVNDSLNKIKRSGSHLLSLINDILEMSRIEAGKMEIINAPLNIREVTENITTMSQALAATKDITFNSDISGVKDLYIFSDELHTNQIILNLISNAIKYSNPGGTVDYRIDQLNAPVDGIANYRVTVKDNGIGMSEEFQKHLFESFAREETSTVSRQEGAGLGLAIVKRIVDLMGGTINVDSRQGVGSTFTVELPLKVLNDSEKEQFIAAHATDTEASDYSRFKGRKVLLVEDNELNREIALDILEEEGLEVEEAEDGSVAVEILREKGPKHYDFILMDIQMPIMNGYEATKAIREMYPDAGIPIIAVSANAFEEDRNASKEAGMDAHVAKPIDVKELFSALAKFL